MYKTWRALKFLIKGPIILMFLFVVNMMTHGHWFHWAALGIGLAWFISLLRVLRAMVMLGGLAALIAYFQKR